ncbi:MAG: hypothetical protein ABFD80_12160 [Acidobacteriota bacterium]
MTAIDPDFLYALSDSVSAAIPFFSLSRYEAFLHSFRLMEALDTNASILGKSIESTLITTRAYQDARQYLIYKEY